MRRLLVILSCFALQAQCRISFYSLVCKQQPQGWEAKRDLLWNYDRFHMATNSTVVVQMDILLKYFTYDMYESMMTVDTWMSLSWNDPKLVWDPESKNIKSFYVSTDEIWYPDLVYSSDFGNDPSIFNSHDCTLTPTGNVSCLVPSKITVFCSSRLRKFPYDVQNCSLTFSSWLHSGERLYFVTGTPPISTESYVENTEWKLSRIQLVRDPGNFSCCPNDTFPTIHFFFIIERHSAAQVCMVIFPVLAIILTTLTTFCLSPEEGERVLLICTNSIIHLFYVQYVYWKLPVGGADPPLILIYARDSFLMAIVSLVLTIGQRRLIKSKAKPPVWMNKFVVKVSSSRLGKYFMIFNENYKNVAKIEEEEDGEAIIEAVEKAESQDWLAFTRILDRIFLVVYAIIYFSMFINFLV